MTSLIQSVSYSTQQLIPNASQFPAPLQIVYDVFHLAHEYWSLYNVGNAYRPKNLTWMAGGYGVNILWGDNRFVTASAQFFYVSKKILRSVKLHNTALKVYQKLEDAVLCNFPVPTTHTWDLTRQSQWISPSTGHKTFKFLYNSEYHIRDIGWEIACLSTTLFELSMTTIDAVMALSLDPSKSEQAIMIKELISNGFETIGQLLDYQQKFIAKLTKNKSILKIILTNIGAPCTADELINTVDEVATKVKQANEYIQDFKKNIDNTFSEALKYLVFGSMSFLQFPTSITYKFLPTKNLFGSEPPKKISCRYAKIYLGNRIPKEPAPKQQVPSIPRNRKNHKSLY
jgi:hypothetical protein